VKHPQIKTEIKMNGTTLVFSKTWTIENPQPADYESILTEYRRKRQKNEILSMWIVQGEESYQFDFNVNNGFFNVLFEGEVIAKNVKRVASVMIIIEKYIDKISEDTHSKISELHKTAKNASNFGEVLKIS
jgi:hypothetical protein